MNRVVVDTDVVSYAMKGSDNFQPYAAELKGREALISFATRAEIHAGMLQNRWGETRKQQSFAYLRRHYTEIGVTNEIIESWATLTAAAVHAGRNLGAMDGWIAATALTLDVPVITNNRRHFQGLPGLKVISYA